LQGEILFNNFEGSHGVLGRTDFEEARELFDCVSHSNQFARVLRHSLNVSGCGLADSFEFLSQGSIFSILRSSSNESIGAIRLLNSHLPMSRCKWEYVISVIPGEQ
jgi:hypothetical protein